MSCQGRGRPAQASNSISNWCLPTKARSAKDRRAAEEKAAYAAEVVNLTPAALARKIAQLEGQMLEHAKNLEFEEAGRIRDQLAEIKQVAFVG